MPVLATLGAFFGLATAAQAQPGNVAVFNNPLYIDNEQSSSFSAEGPNTVASLQSFGENVTQFTDLSAAGFSAALVGKDSLVLPEEEHSSNVSCLGTDMAADAKAVVRNFVQAGGQLVVMAVGEDGCKEQLLNDIFGFSLVTTDDLAASKRLLLSGPFDLTAAAAGTEFAGGPASIPGNDATGLFSEASLPTGGRSIYSDGSGSGVVADIPYGDGSITTLGWDWYDSSPPDTLGTPPTAPAVRGAQTRGSNGQDFGWQDVLRRSVDLPVLSVNDVSVTEGNSGTTPATFTVSASQAHSEVIHVAYATADGSAVGPTDYAPGSGALSIARTDLSGTVTVQVNGDTTVEPNETFSVNLSAPFPAAIGDGTGVGTIVNDDVAAPKVGVAGVRRACVSNATRVRFSINAPAGIASVRVTLDGKRVATTTKSRFTVNVNAKKLKAGRHRLVAVATDKAGKVTTLRRTISVCAAAKPKRVIAPRFTG